jgi:uncharacterized integral membrane protein
MRKQEQEPDPADTRASASPDVRSEPAASKQYVGTGVVVSLVIGLLVAVAAIIFIAQNGERIALEWLWADFGVSLAVVVLGAIVFGIIVDESVGLAWRRMRRRRLQERDELLALREEVEIDDLGAPAPR